MAQVVETLSALFCYIENFISRVTKQSKAYDGLNGNPAYRRTLYF